MRRNLGLLLSTCTCVFLSSLAFADDEEALLAAEYVHNGVPYPPVFLVTNIEDESFLEKLDSYGAFTRFDEDAIGLPIGIRIVKGHRTKADGTSTSSGFLSAVTLGIVPMVSNTEFRVRYDVFVQGKRIADFDYTMDTLEVDSAWTIRNKEFETKPDEEVFLLQSIAQFLTELRKETSVHEVFAEYELYFGES